MRIRKLALLIGIASFVEAGMHETDSTVVALLLSANGIENLSVSEVASVGGNNGRVATLNVSGRGIYRLIPQIVHLDSLFTLNLADNNLEHLDAELWRLPSLKILDISKNAMETLPDSITRLDLGYSFLDDNGMAHIVTGLFVDSNHLCDLSPATENWLDINTSPAGNPNWRNTQKCESRTKSLRGSLSNERQKQSVTSGRQIWNLLGRTIPDLYRNGDEKCTGYTRQYVISTEGEGHKEKYLWRTK